MYDLLGKFIYDVGVSLASVAAIAAAKAAVNASKKLSARPPSTATSHFGGRQYRVFVLPFSNHSSETLT